MAQIAGDRRQTPPTQSTTADNRDLNSLSAAGNRRDFLALMGRAAAGVVLGGATVNQARAQEPNDPQRAATQTGPTVDPKTTVDIARIKLKGVDFLYGSDGTPKPVATTNATGYGFSPSAGTVMQAVSRGLQAIRQANGGTIPEGASFRLQLSVNNTPLGETPVDHKKMPEEELDMLRRDQVRARMQMPEVKAVCDFIARNSMLTITPIQDQGNNRALMLQFMHADPQRNWNTPVKMNLIMDLPKTDSAPAVEGSR